MSLFFWETTQKARERHFCDFCCGFIEPGQEYTRKAWNIGKGRLLILREHDSPVCEQEEDPEWVRTQQTQIKLGVAIMLEVRVMEVLKVQIDGSTVTEQESVLVPTFATETVPDWDNDEDIAF